ncbi:MAG: hypothetical protein RL547_91 [Actinomycetota bacterium]
MGHPLVVNALELLRRPGSHKDVVIEVDPADVNLADDQRLVPDSTIGVRLECASTNDGIVVAGSLTVRFHGACRRCLRDVDGERSVEVHELYQQSRTVPDAFPIENDQIDLRPMVRETVLLDVPDAPLCRPDCPGMCPICGADRATETCACAVETVDPRWSVLSELRDTLPE